jgi:hypothetical protein
VPEFLVNTSTVGGWIELHLAGRTASRWPAGTRVRAQIGDREVIRELRTGSSYCSSGPAVVHLGLGESGSATIEIQWPGGETERLGSIETGTRALIREGLGVVARR